MVPVTTIVIEERRAGKQGKGAPLFPNALEFVIAMEPQSRIQTICRKHNRIHVRYMFIRSNINLRCYFLAYVIVWYETPPPPPPPPPPRFGGGGCSRVQIILSQIYVATYLHYVIVLLLCSGYETGVPWWLRIQVRSLKTIINWIRLPGPSFLY